MDGSSNNPGQATPNRTDADEFNEAMMSPAQQNSRRLIKHVVEPILHWVERSEVSEVAINRPEEIWLKLRKPDENGNIWVMRRDLNLDRRALEHMLHLLANTSNMSDFGPDKTPITYGTLPGGHRYCGGYGPNLLYYSKEIDMAGTVVFICRQRTKRRTISLESYGLRRGQDLPHYDAAGDRKQDGSDPIGKILNSVMRGDHMLISGATDTGKTTLMNELLSWLPKRLRILTVQDTLELDVEQPNRLHVVVPRDGGRGKFSYKHVVDLIVRSTPDVVVAGEVSTTNAAAIWELMRGGHGSFMTTIHAETVREAVSTFMTRISHTAPGEVADRERLADEMHAKLRIVQIVRDAESNRRIVQVT